MKRYIFNESKLDAVIRAAYELSSPQGLGFLHYTPEPMDDATLADIKSRPGYSCRASMDYVNGRSVKLGIHGSGDMLYISADRWYDHSEKDLRELASRAQLGEPVDIPEPTNA